MYSWPVPGRKPGNVDEGHEGDVEGVAEAYEARALARCVAVEHTGEIFGLVGHDADGLAVEAGEADDDILGVVALYLEELTVVDDGTDDLIHVVWTVGRVGNNLVERILETVDGVVALHQRRLFEVVLGDEAEELADDSESLLAVLGCEVGHAALL